MNSVFFFVAYIGVLYAEFPSDLNLVGWLLSNILDSIGRNYLASISRGS